MSIEFFLSDNSENKYAKEKRKNDVTQNNWNLSFLHWWTSLRTMKVAILRNSTGKSTDHRNICSKISGNEIFRYAIKALYHSHSDRVVHVAEK